MTYEIQSKSDFQVGATLIVRLPEEELDRKALRTIQFDRPSFLLPFRCRFIDGEAELTYQIGNHSKFAYLSGNRTPSEYADMWSGLLQPLLDCGDWFMQPESFVLSPEYLYCDKAVHAIRFVYIPSIRPCSDGQDLKRMVTEAAKMNHVTDVNLENKVIWAIQDFNIHSFLQTVRENRGAAPAPDGGHRSAPAPDGGHRSAPAPARETPTPHLVQPPAEQPRGPLPEGRAKAAPSSPAPAGRAGREDDIQIQFPPSGKAEKEHKPKGGLFGPKKEKKEKEEKPKNKGGGLFGKKRTQQEIVGGAAAQPYQPPAAPVSAPGYVPPPADAGGDDVTVVDQPETGGTRFRYVGAGGHPQFIEVSVDPGAVFTIGRFDESVGVRQSSFEFPKKTKAVSRRHAAVERRADGYYIVDLGSSAGTFLNGQKLPPNAPFRLEQGCRISFGFSGADYMWEDQDI